MPSWPLVTAVGALIGVLFGLFGVGGSSFATPALGLLGVSGLVAVAAPSHDRTVSGWLPEERLECSIGADVAVVAVRAR